MKKMELQWKIGRSTLNTPRHLFSVRGGPRNPPRAGDGNLHLVDANGFVINPDIAREYVERGQLPYQSALVEFEVWASTRKGHCRICGDLPATVDTRNEGYEEREGPAIKTECVHGNLVVQYYILSDEEAPIVENPVDDILDLARLGLVAEVDNDSWRRAE